MSKVIKTSGVLFVILILILVSVFISVRTEYLRNIIKGVVERSLSSAAGQNFTVGEIDGDFIHNIRLKDISFKIQGEPFVHLDEFSVKYSLLSIIDPYVLFSKVVPIEDISFSGLRVDLVRDENGNLNINRIGGAGGKKGEGKGESVNWNIFLKDLLITDAKITVEDRGKKEASSIEIPYMDLSIKMFGITRKIDLNLRKADIYTSPQHISIKGLSTKAIYTENKAQVNGLNANVNGTRVKFDGEVSNFIEPKFKFKAAAYGLNIEEGTLNTEIEGSGQYKSPGGIHAQVGVNLPDSQIMGKKVEGSIGRIKVEGTDVEIQNGVVKTGFGEAVFMGDANLGYLLRKEGVNEFNLKLSLRDINLSRIPEVVRSQSEIGVANADFDIEGKWKEIRDLEARVNINRFQQRGKLGEVKLRGVIEATRSNARFDLVSNLSKVNLYPILNDKRYGSNLNSDLRFKGSAPLNGRLEGLTVALNGEILPSSISNVNLTGGDISASYASKTLNIKSLSINSDSFRLKTQGTLAEEKRMDFGYEVDINDLNFTSKFLPQYHFNGSLHASGKVQGEIKNPQVAFSARVSDFEYKDIKVKLANLDGVTSVNFENPQFGVKGALSGVQFEKRDIQSVDFRVAGEGKGLRGNFSILEDPQRSYEVELRLADLKSREKSIELNRVRLNLRNKTLQNRDVITLIVSPEGVTVKSLNLYYGNNFVVGDVAVDFNGVIDAALGLKRINLVDISEVLGLKTPVRGITSGTINFQGTPEQPDIKVNLSIQGLGFMDFMSDNSSLSLSYSNKSLNLGFTVSENAQQVLSVKGGASVDLNLKNVQENMKDATFNLVLKSSGIDVSPLAKLNEEIREIHGKAILDLHASGSVESPKVNGEVRLQNISLKIQSLRSEIRAITGLIEMQGERGIIRALEIQTDDGGRGTIQGDFNLRELSYNLSGKLNDFGVNLKQVTANVDGDMGIKGSKGKVNISGDIRVNRARIRIPEEPTKEVEDIKFVDERKEEPQQFVISEVKQTDYFRDNVGMNLGVFIPGNTWAKGKGANIEVKGKIGVIKKYGEPVILTGNIETIRGTYEFFGKLFRIERGRVSFRGTPEINPFLDVRALYKVSDVKIFVNVNGTVEKPSLKLSSEPPMEQTDIFSYLAFGTSSDKIGAGQRTNLQSKAAEVAALMAAGKLKDIVGEKFRLDVVSITGGQKGLQDAQIEVGKYLTDRLYIAYERSPEDTVSTPYLSTTETLTNKVRVEYRLFDFLTLESTVGQVDQGGDIFFTFDY
jgi:translocation and assembly module TamB